MRIVIVPTLALLLFLSIFPPIFMIQAGQIKNPYDLIVATIEGGMPETADPAWCYDTASGELIFNVYETLLFYDGECIDRFIPQLATDWRIENITETTSPEGLAWYYRYVFQIRTDMPYHGGDWGPAGKYTLTTADVEYSFERAMVQDRYGGPTWMFYEPLLNTWGAEGLGNLSSTEDVITVGKMIDHAVESNSTHVWFNLAFPGAYAPFPQILAQPWASVLSKAWVNDYVIGVLGRPDWSGDWVDYTEWVAYHDPEISPLDDPTMIMCGTGPYQLETYSSREEYWSVLRFPEYWGGWPARVPAPPYPSVPAHVKPAGYLERVKLTWHYVWEKRRDMFLFGDVDVCAVPRSYMDQVLEQPGVRCIYLLPALSVSNLFFTFDIDPSTPYGKIYDYGEFHEDGVPRDFFGNPDWGIHTRKAFAYAFDYDSFLQDAFRDEAIQPPTAIIPGLPYHDPTIPRYTYNLTKAEEEFKLVPGLWEKGFTLSFLYNTGNLARETAGKKIKYGIESLNPKFHVNVVGLAWSGGYTPPIVHRQLALFIIRWLVDYPDPHNFAVPFYASYDTFAKWQAYNNPVMDELIERGIREHDPEVRRQIYHDIQVLAVEDCPSVPLYQPLNRHFERDWMNGWYYNPAYSGYWMASVYAYHLWKQYYMPHALTDGTPPHQTANLLPCDVNYDGKVNILDIALVAQAYGSSFGPPLHPRWNFRCDVDNNRVINIIDIAAVAKYFRRTSATWTP